MYTTPHVIHAKNIKLRLILKGDYHTSFQQFRPAGSHRRAAARLRSSFVAVREFVHDRHNFTNVSVHSGRQRSISAAAESQVDVRRSNVSTSDSVGLLKVTHAWGAAANAHCTRAQCWLHQYLAFLYIAAPELKPPIC